MCVRTHACARAHARKEWFSLSNVSTCPEAPETLVERDLQGGTRWRDTFDLGHFDVSLIQPSPQIQPHSIDDNIIRCGKI